MSTLTSSRAVAALWLTNFGYTHKILPIVTVSDTVKQNAAAVLVGSEKAGKCTINNDRRHFTLELDGVPRVSEFIYCIGTLTGRKNGAAFVKSLYQPVSMTNHDHFGGVTLANRQNAIFHQEICWRGCYSGCGSKTQNCIICHHVLSSKTTPTSNCIQNNTVVGDHCSSNHSNATNRSDAHRGMCCALHTRTT